MRFLFFHVLGILLHFRSYLTDNNFAQRCRDSNNKPVAWWYIYKPPAVVIPPYNGLNFSYVTPDTGGRWVLSPVDITDDNMLSNTLMPKYKRSSSMIGRAVVIFQSLRSKESQTSARGVMMADRAGGFLLTHSVPGFAAKINSLSSFPTEQLQNGHLISCVSLDLDALNEVATALREIVPNITFTHVPDPLIDFLPEWDFVGPDSTYYRKETSMFFLIRGNGSGLITDSTEAVALLVARPPGEKTCIYSTFAARQQVMLNVYGHSRSPYLTTVCSEKFGVRNIESLCLKFVDDDYGSVYYVTNSTDYSWFAVSTAADWQLTGAGPQQFWVCTSLVDKEASQEGGLLLCLQNYELWRAVDNLKVAEPSCDYNRMAKI